MLIDEYEFDHVIAAEWNDRLGNAKSSGLSVKRMNKLEL